MQVIANTICNEKSKDGKLNSRQVTFIATLPYRVVHKVITKGYTIEDVVNQLLKERGDRMSMEGLKVTYKMLKCIYYSGGVHCSDDMIEVANKLKKKQ